VLKFDEGVIGPKTSPKLFSSHQLTGMFKQNPKDLKRLLGQTDDFSVPVMQFPRTKIKAMVFEPKFTSTRLACLHGKPLFGAILSFLISKEFHVVQGKNFLRDASAVGGWTIL
jgi:hypothetical protein